MLRVRCNDLFHKNAIGIWLLEDKQGSNYVAKPTQLVFDKKDDGTFQLPEPTFEFRTQDARDFFQGLCNELGRLGYRPDTDRLAGELKGTKNHLEGVSRVLDRTLDLLDRTIRLQAENNP